MFFDGKECAAERPVTALAGHLPVGLVPEVGRDLPDFWAFISVPRPPSRSCTSPFALRADAVEVLRSALILLTTFCVLSSMVAKFSGLRAAPKIWLNLAFACRSTVLSRFCAFTPTDCAAIAFAFC